MESKTRKEPATTFTVLARLHNNIIAEARQDLYTPTNGRRSLAIIIGIPNSFGIRAIVDLVDNPRVRSASPNFV
jgi:hypothetical protein